MPTDSQAKKDPPKPTTRPAPAKDPVEEASEESFPASDPPSWEPLHPGKPAKHPEPPRGPSKK